MFVAKSFFIFSVLFCSLVNSKPADPDASAQIVKFDNDLRLDGYNFDFETSNGIKRTEAGVLKPGTGKDNDQTLNVDGDFSFTFPDGTPFSVKFVATEDGYRPTVVIGQGRAGK
ncbi:flexible cuticle protein 12 [Leptinotarsa decemlineata]|uniref:Cuticular protein 18 n=1 Tax=Leptinotarsa decemlineata TaxID=7539 RepID=A8W7B3_LEPDE|nr:flexible cuticle protein 12-like [Leptinotarsa decemlineata]ABW74144.1 cuticular protein Ld-CP4 [Leptinotarsa decemlineata]AYA49896.1 cuticular protein 18 [Leptinotarsa decemlineata]